ncbi:hypothetical protein CEE45_08015 [Candidatus Heimdallarchaeota archaeon B3_Heim]|nr:MAG: hypothetical protein CEE45_08015 [Candidatus Heimdallarchaeota archaeon B3_Heim]
MGMTVVRVNEAYTSQMCSKCGYIDKKNRKSRGSFYCLQCGVHLHADINAASNILHRFHPDSQVVPTDSNSSLVTILLDSGYVTHPVQNSF